MMPGRKGRGGCVSQTRYRCQGRWQCAREDTKQVTGSTLYWKSGLLSGIIIWIVTQTLIDYRGECKIPWHFSEKTCWCGRREHVVNSRPRREEARVSPVSILGLGSMVELCTTGEMWCVIGDTGLSKVCPCWVVPMEYTGGGIYKAVGSTGPMFWKEMAGYWCRFASHQVLLETQAMILSLSCPLNHLRSWDSSWEILI